MLKNIGMIFLIIMTIVSTFSIKGCQCRMRAGNGLVSHYNILVGCVFEKPEIPA